MAGVLDAGRQHLHGGLAELGGEIDILEWHSNEPTWMKSAVHYFANGAAQHFGTGATGATASRIGFHIYEVEWTAGQMVFRLDNQVVPPRTSSTTRPRSSRTTTSS